MLIDNINLNHIRIFESVYRNRSMTKAAEELHMTQSGVSQHVKLLEDILEVKLFDRVKQRLIPTKSADNFFEKSSVGLYQIEEGISFIKSGKWNFAGTIKLGIPPEFGNNKILPLLANYAKEYPKIRYLIEYCSPATINERLLTGQYDFSLIDESDFDKEINTIKIYQENLVLCCTQKYLENKRPHTHLKSFFESLDYIDYTQKGKMLENYFRIRYNLMHPKLRIRASLMNVQGVYKFIKNDFGVGVLPEYYAHQLLKKNIDLHFFTGNESPVINIVYLAYLKHRSFSPIINSLITYLKENLKNTQQFKIESLQSLPS